MTSYDSSFFAGQQTGARTAACVAVGWKSERTVMAIDSFVAAPGTPAPPAH